jgi:hypothetical protein
MRCRVCRTTSYGYRESRSWDRAGRLTALENRQGATVLSGFAYTLDQTGNPTLVQSPGETISYVDLCGYPHNAIYLDIGVIRT